MTKLAIIPVMLLVVGCASAPKPNLISTEYKVLTPPEDFYNCPQVTEFPNSDTLTDRQVGSLLIKLQSNNVKCKRSLAALKKFNVDAKRTVEANNKKNQAPPPEEEKDAWWNVDFNN